jgi:hypothetical protein
MPYISKEAREEVKAFGPRTAGELNYAITLLIKDYQTHKGLSYQTINDIVGALEGAKLEYTRRIVGPYENSKLSENGDVY